MRRIGAVEIEREHVRPRSSSLERRQRRARVAGGAVDEDVERARLRDHFVDEPRGVGAIAQIALHDRALPGSERCSSRRRRRPSRA